MEIISHVKNGVLVALLTLAGCNSREVKLDEKFLPLRTVEEVTDKLPILPQGLVTTIYSHSYTNDLTGLVRDRPVGSVSWDALFFHEREHALHEFADPTLLARYVTDSTARWAEESAAYRVEIKYLLAHGVGVNVDGYVRAMTDPAYGGMVSAEDARAFVLKVVSEP